MSPVRLVSAGIMNGQMCQFLQSLASCMAFNMGMQLHMCVSVCEWHVPDVLGSLKSLVEAGQCGWSAQVGYEGGGEPLKWTLSSL